MDDSYRKALCKIQRYKKISTASCCCGAIVGPTGPAGPATIEVGTTTTGLPGSEASVTNSGTNENVILDFVIPQGLQGETGPTGPIGPIGQSPNLTIGTVTTGAPGSAAAATITGTAPNFQLNLVIPQGPTGPAGP